MIIVCPNCSTRFNLPDAQVRPGVRLRCSVCKHVFPLPGDSDASGWTDPATYGTASHGLSGDDDGCIPPPARKGSRRGLLVLTILLGLVLCVAGYLFVASPEGRKLFQQDETASEASMVSDINLVDVRQYPVSNEQIGSITVIEGKLVNNAAEPRELIRLAASLYDKDNKVLVTREQLAGNAVSLFQLQVLSESELEQALANRLGVLEYNTNVAVGGVVPFMVVFSNPPREAVEFGVKVIAAQRPEAR